MGYLRRLAFIIGAAALFAGCGGSQPPIGGAPATSPLASPLKRTPLLYVVSDMTEFYVVDYVTGELKQKIRFASSGIGTDACSDAAGDVFITAVHGYLSGHTQGQILEYQHGASIPIEALDVDGAWPGRCSVDPTTGNLAVTIGNASSQYVAVYPQGQNPPVTYSDPNIDEYLGVTYDDQGNLFILGWTNGFQTIELAELGRGSSSFVDITLNEKISGNRLQWDGTYLAVTSGANNKRSSAKIYRISVAGSSGTVVSTVTFFRASGYLAGLASLILSDRVILTSHRGEMNIYKYPAGGHILRQIGGLARYRKAGLALSR